MDVSPDHAETFPAASRARTEKAYVWPGDAPNVALVAAVAVRQVTYGPNPPLQAARR